MYYLPELYYFFDTDDFPLKKAIVVTAKTISQWSTTYEAKIMIPFKGKKEQIRKGTLPASPAERQKFVVELYEWIFANSELSDAFTLMLDKKFEHYDDTCCWVLDLTEDEFAELQKVWEEAGLPADLFYSEDKVIEIEKPLGPIARFFTKFGFSFTNTAIYSPKQWEARHIK
ncbi:hypothetical protein COV82_00505 [Candidatus Peregrinibacteria bacterium CG11_big_fil_rev_8_21_14_0_20_46_8]|nr:MAG: hypothetical protein COV82_00505 [Candidatus Peregrinibacteria bacterium CG11_big_fil_rev_8_21_14_0_20_46_8]